MVHDSTMVLTTRSKTTTQNFYFVKKKMGVIDKIKASQLSAVLRYIFNKIVFDLSVNAFSF